jgi:N-acetyltransferase
MKFDFKKEIILENDRALLRPLKEEDFEKLLPVAIDDATLLQYSPAKIASEADLKNYIRIALNERETKFRYAFSIFDKMKNAYAGSTSYATISNYDKRLEIGWTWIGRKFQKTGLNRNCKMLLLTYAFETLEFERVEFRTDERNATSRAAIEKIGGKFEGILRSHTLMNDGHRRNTVYYSILKEEWLKGEKFIV